jgi:hypothetical protein
MNASDIVKAKQNQTLYKAYYQPTVFQSTIYSTINLVSSNGSGSEYTSCINTAYTYLCNPTFISYELANDVNKGSFICGGKTPSKLTWKNNISTLLYTTSTVISSTVPSTFITGSTFVMGGANPIICPDPIFVQGTNFQNTCDVCNNWGAGANACCHNCASGQ